MQRYVIRKIDCALRPNYSWLVIDCESYTVARLNDTWLENLTESEASTLAEKLNHSTPASGAALQYGFCSPVDSSAPRA